MRWQKLAGYCRQAISKGANFAAAAAAANDDDDLSPQLDEEQNEKARAHDEKRMEGKQIKIKTDQVQTMD